LADRVKAWFFLVVDAMSLRGTIGRREARSETGRPALGDSDESSGLIMPDIDESRRLDVDRCGLSVAASLTRGDSAGGSRTLTIGTVGAEL